jgi:myo-inositol-1(or 4)-monophosphatase
VKGPGDFVSAADKRAEKTVFEELSKARPGYGFVMEESGEVEGSDKSHTWYIDPLDGTTNFLHSIPIFGVSIALEREGQLVAGLVYNPAVDDMFVAERGQGAYLNNRRLRVSARRKLSDAILGCGIPHAGKRAQHAPWLTEAELMMGRVSNLRRLGAAALDLCYVAAGRYDGYWERELHSWDMAAGIVMVREAGGFVADCDGGDDMLGKGTICAGNETLQPQMLDLLASTRRKAAAPATV